MTKNTRSLTRTLLAVIAIVAALVIVSTLPMVSAEEAIDLRSADPFAILASSTVTNTGSSVINGDLGLHPGTSVTGFPPGTVNGEVHIADAVAERAKVNLTAAYVDAAGRQVNATLMPELGGQELIPGVYDSETGKFQLTGELTLNAGGDPDAVWIFQMESTLITAVDSSVLLTHGAQACNVYWQVGSSATIDTRTVFKGNILAKASISMKDEATLEGRALARDGAVTLINNAITIAQCAAEELPDEEPPGEEPPGEEPPGEEPPGEEPPGDEPSPGCSTGLMATANADSSITLTWDHIEGAEQYRVYRTDPDGAFILHAEVDGDATSFNDTDTETGVTYGYEVRPLIAGVESEDCDRVEVTAIPSFPALLAVTLALAGGVAAYAVNRRRP